MIYTFLNSKKDATAVAFQKRAEVPGFHRQYWHLYQKFPNRIQVVVMKDAGYICPEPILKKHAWLDKQYNEGKLGKPFQTDAERGTYNKYLSVALLGRNFQ